VAQPQTESHARQHDQGHLSDTVARHVAGAADEHRRFGRSAAGRHSPASDADRRVEVSNGGSAQTFWFVPDPGGHRIITASGLMLDVSGAVNANVQRWILLPMPERLGDDERVERQSPRRVGRVAGQRSRATRHCAFTIATGDVPTGLRPRTRRRIVARLLGVS
jgi:hypothetical protein